MGKEIIEKGEKLDMLLTVLNALNVLKDWSNLLLVCVGLSAFGVYYWQKRDEKRAAATLVKGQIDLIEERVRALKDDHQLGNISVYHSKIILDENLWEKYKHILIKNLQKSDVEIIQKFFDNAEQIEHARSDIIQTLNRAWEHKSLVEHQVAGELIKIEIDKKLSTKTGEKTEVEIDMNKVEAFKQMYNPLELVFTPDIAISALVIYLTIFDMLSGTTAYKKIQSWSYDNK